MHYQKILSREKIYLKDFTKFYTGNYSIETFLKKYFDVRRQELILKLTPSMRCRYFDDHR